jgi:uncharacterized phiE125 gp8 family phage protein
METVVKTAVTEANEPLLALVRESGAKYINQFITYPTSGGNSDELAMINKMCISVRELCQKELNISLAQQTLVTSWYLEEVKRKKFLLDIPYGPISSITSFVISYSDGSTDTTLTSGTDYYLEGNQYKRANVPKILSVGSGAVSCYKVEYVAGFGAAGCETIPEILKQIMAKQVVQWYAKRDDYTSVLSRETRNALQQFTKKLWI